MGPQFILYLSADINIQLDNRMEKADLELAQCINW